MDASPIAVGELTAVHLHLHLQKLGMQAVQRFQGMMQQSDCTEDDTKACTGHECEFGNIAMQRWVMQTCVSHVCQPRTILPYSCHDIVDIRNFFVFKHFLFLFLSLLFKKHNSELVSSPAAERIQFQPGSSCRPPFCVHSASTSAEHKWLQSIWMLFPPSHQCTRVSWHLVRSCWVPPLSEVQGLCCQETLQMHSLEFCIQTESV